MKLSDLYEIGRKLNLGFGLESDQKKLDFVRFRYSSKEIISTTVILLGISLVLTGMTSILLPVWTFSIFFLGVIFSIVVYIYPVHIYYYQELMNYNEQMLRAVLSMTNFISMRTSFEYAFIETTSQIKGVLKIEFEEITHKLERKQETSLGDAFEPYIPKWIETNPVFVKSLRLLQTALMADDSERDEILKETIRTLMINFKIQGKRSSEELAGKAKNLVAFGVLLPVTSLMLLPLLSIFLTGVPMSAYIFIFNVAFPVIILLMALEFATRRIQIDTIDLELSPGFKRMPVWIYGLCGLIIFTLSIPGLVHLSNVSENIANPVTAELEYQFIPVFKVWLIPASIMLAIYIFAAYYIHIHEKLWKDVKETEDDLPHLLQILSTYLSLGISMENIIPRINRDYREEGFPDHPVVKVFTQVARKLMSSKEAIEIFIAKVLREFCPSVKVSNILIMIISFSRISLESATKAARLIREQTISVIELDDYIRTLLAETIALITVAITMLMPLLAAVSVIMSLVIVKSLTFISQVLGEIGASFGTDLSMDLVDVTKIMPPTQIEIIVGIYFIEMFLVLTLFATKIEIGNDKFKLAKNIKQNSLGFIIFSIILLAGHFVMMEFFFRDLLGEGAIKSACAPCKEYTVPDCVNGTIDYGTKDKCGCTSAPRCVLPSPP